MNDAELIIFLGKLPIDPTLLHVTIRNDAGIISSEPFHQDVWLDFSLGNDELDKAWLEEWRKRHPRYLQPVTLTDGREGTIVLIHDAQNFEIDLGDATETIHERNIADDRRDHDGREHLADD